MRLAVNASIVDPVPTGLGVYCVNLLRALVPMHKDLLVYTSAPGVCGIDAGLVRTISSRVQPSRGRRGHLQRLAWIQTGLALRLIADRATALLSPVPESMLFPVVPQIVVVHDLIPLRFPEAFPRQAFYFRRFVPAMLGRCRAVIADSESTKQDLLGSYPIAADRIHVVPCGYAADVFRPGLDADPVKRTYGLDRYVLYVGNLLPHKNLARLVDAFATTAATTGHVLVIAGRRDPRYYPALEARVRSLGLASRVRFLDYVAAADLPRLYAGADVFVLPSLHEGFGLPVLEAMACGTPVIASRAGSLPEAAGQAARLIDPHDTRALARALEAVLHDPAARETMRDAGLAQVRRFSWDGTAARILEILHASLR